MNWFSLIAPGVTLAITALGIYSTYLIFRTKTEASLKTVADQIIDTNMRVSDLAAGTKTASNELHEFKAHIERHFVEKDELSDLQNSMDRSWERMESKLDAALGTMSDVRDEVIKITARGGKSNVPPTRRATPKTGPS